MKYAIIESGGKQYKAVEGSTIEVDRLPEKVGENIKLEKVLLFVDEDKKTIGTPLIKDSPVWVKVLEHFKGDKVVIFHYRPKKRIRTKTGHRQNYTRLSIEQIGGTEFVEKKVAKTSESIARRTKKIEKKKKNEVKALDKKGTKPIPAQREKKETKPATGKTKATSPASQKKTTVKSTIAKNAGVDKKKVTQKSLNKPRTK